MLPMSKAAVYDYSVPHGMLAEEGVFVRVPLGPRDVNGVIWSLEPKLNFPPEKLKDIKEILPCAPLCRESREFVEWVANYTLQGSGRVLRMCMSVPDALLPKKPKKGYRTGSATDIRLTAARKRVLEFMQDGLAHSSSEIADITGVSSSVIKGLADVGALETLKLPSEPPVAIPDPDKAGYELTEDQMAAAGKLAEAVRCRRFSATLLEGVTGSGKTEVYFEAIAQALRQDQQALVLLPEIALSSQWLGRFEKRFGVKPVEWHSDLGAAERRRNWRAVIEGRAKVVVGARSALFLPFKYLGLIIVDEEHEASFKQDEGISYNARDMAVVRANIGKFPVVLASATPALETVVNARTGKYDHVVLASRFGKASLPDIEVVDLKDHRPGAQRWISDPLREAVETTLANGQQAMLFINRRGYAPLTLCDACGFRLQCPHCSAWLVEHRLSKRLQCHHCGYSSHIPEQCPDCGEKDSFKACGPGIERLTEEASMLFPDARLQMIASDTMSGPGAAERFVAAMSAGEIDLLIGTQIVAKGYHFPNLTLVGIVDADLGLAGGDLRASERSFQLLSQVAGRAGRAENPGKVILQTHLPDHPVMEAMQSGDSLTFIESEMQMREFAGMPPYGRLGSLILSSVEAESLNIFARELAMKSPSGENFMIMGPAPAPLAMIRGRHRVRFLVKTMRDVNIQNLIRSWLKGVKIPSNIRLQIDIDPYNFM